MALQTQRAIKRKPERQELAGIGTEASVIAPMMIVRKNTPVRELKEIQPRCYNEAIQLPNQ